MIVVLTDARRFLFTMRQNIQHDHALMVPALFCEDMSPRPKNSYYLPHAFPGFSINLQVAGCCPTAGPLVVSLEFLSIEVFCIKAYYHSNRVTVSLKDSTTRHRTQDNT